MLKIDVCDPSSIYDEIMEQMLNIEVASFEGTGAGAAQARFKGERVANRELLVDDVSGGKKRCQKPFDGSISTFWEPTYRAVLSFVRLKLQSEKEK